MLLQKQGMVEGLTMLKNEHGACEGCTLRNQHSKKFHFHVDNRKREILELMHTYVCDPLQTKPLEHLISLSPLMIASGLLEYILSKKK